MDIKIKERIGQTIGALLAEQNKKQKDLAKELGVTDNTISYIVAGKRAPNLAQITTIASFLMYRPILFLATITPARRLRRLSA